MPTRLRQVCIDALKDAIALHGVPEVFNTDQGSQFTSSDFTSVLEGYGVAISMDGKGRWIDNVFIERFWRSLKYENVYLHAYEDLAAARRGIEAYIAYYFGRRRHASLGRRTPCTLVRAPVRFRRLVTFETRASSRWGLLPERT